LDSYLTLKLLHILAAVVVTGTGAGIAFFMLMAYRSNHVHVIHVTAQHVILADWLFTLPAVITQLITGVLLMRLQGYSFSSPWFYWVLGLFVFIALCWLPVLRIQYQFRQLAQESLATNQVSLQFRGLMRIWILLGIPAFCAILAIFWLMVFKPLPMM